MADTRAKVQTTVDRVEKEVADLRAEVEGLQELKQEVTKLRSEMVTMPKVEAKLSEMNEGIQQTLQLILQQMNTNRQKAEVVTLDTKAPEQFNQDKDNDHIPVTVPGSTTVPVAPVSRNLEQEFRVSGKVPVTNITDITTELSHTQLMSESTECIVISNRNQE